MNDVEHDLRELFDRKAGSVGGVAPKLPEPVRKRSRRRELGTVLVGGVTIVALVLGSLAASRVMDLGSERRTVASPQGDGERADLVAVHDQLEAALHRLWSELAYLDELDGEVKAAQRDLAELADEIGPGGPTEEQADRMMAYQDSIVRFETSIAEHLASVESLRLKVESLRGARNLLVEESDPALFPTTVTVICTGDREGGTNVSGPAIHAQEDGVHIDVMNAIPNERVFLDLGTHGTPIEVAGGQRIELVLDEIVPRTLELVCTYETPPETWRRPTHPLTVIAASS